MDMFQAKDVHAGRTGGTKAPAQAGSLRTPVHAESLLDLDLRANIIVGLLLYQIHQHPPPRWVSLGKRLCQSYVLAPADTRATNSMSCRHPDGLVLPGCSSHLLIPAACSRACICHSLQQPAPTPCLTCPVMATRGTESSIASARPVTRLVAPGPDVAMHTPT